MHRIECIRGLNEDPFSRGMQLRRGNRRTSYRRGSSRGEEHRPRTLHSIGLSCAHSPMQQHATTTTTTTRTHGRDTVQHSTGSHRKKQRDKHNEDDDTTTTTHARVRGNGGQRVPHWMPLLLPSSRPFDARACDGAFQSCPRPSCSRPCLSALSAGARRREQHAARAQATGAATDAHARTQEHAHTHSRQGAKHDSAATRRASAHFKSAPLRPVSPRLFA